VKKSLGEREAGSAQKIRQLSGKHVPNRYPGGKGRRPTGRGGRVTKRVALVIKKRGFSRFVAQPPPPPPPPM